MKILEFKFLKIFYLNLIVLVYMLPSFGVAGGGLYAQDPILFEHTWYFVNGNQNGENFYPLSYFTGNLDFYEKAVEIYHIYCESAGGASLIELNNEIFHLNDFSVPFQGNCIESDEVMFLNMHYSIFGNWNTGICNTPFSYTIESVDDYYQLTIVNNLGDWSVYNSVYLSTPEFNTTAFIFYPNPVKENLNINNTSNQSVTATLYDITGKQLKSHSLETNLSIIDVKELKSGLYFVVFESEVGERVSKKFVKQ